VCELHDQLEAGGFTGEQLQKLLVRILFCLFAEDTGLFEPNAFQAFVRGETREDGSDLGARVNELFDLLNTPLASRSPELDEDLAQFPYVNGELFAERLGFPRFNRSMRDQLLQCSEFQWAKISPAVFGSLVQGILKKEERRQQGASYTSERDIMKVLRSLFLDDLQQEFRTICADRSTRRRGRLEEFHTKLREITLLDPACGCGNFLVLAYRELRLLELDLLRELYSGTDQRVLDISQIIRVDVDQFYGIEISAWPVEIARVAMWLLDHQMNQRVSEVFGQYFQRLPLRTTPHIVADNALRVDWCSVLPRERCTYLLGNPPFVGKKREP
jgi:type I restriction-modification system DNA methylase subunit